VNTPFSIGSHSQPSNNGTADSNRNASRPDPQVSERATRRRFTVAYKLRILKEADACHKPGELGALLRREGLYSATLASFRKQHADGKLVVKNAQQAHRQRQDKAAKRQREARRIAALEAENHKLRLLLDLQKKVAALLDIAWSTEPSA
jgi:transposase